ncbi:MAG: DciA family protein [Patescibacteria group bacterium]
MAWQPIRRILPGAIANREVAKKVEATRVLQMAHMCLVQLWGEEKASYVQFQSFAEGQLTAYASAPAAAQELRMTEMRLRNEVNRMVGMKAVLSLNIRHGSLIMPP